MTDDTRDQIGRLADYLMSHFPDEIGAGDPVHGEGAVDVAIRLLSRLEAVETICMQIGEGSDVEAVLSTA